MIIYNVTISVEPAYGEEWERWMKEDHMPEVMATGMFTDCRLCHLLEQDETDGITYSAQYLCDSMVMYELYIEVYATELREKTNARFGGKFVAFRTIMETV